MLARSDAAIEQARQPGPAKSARVKDPLRLGRGRAARRMARRGERDGRSASGAADRPVALDAWNDLQVVLHASWLGRLLRSAEASGSHGAGASRRRQSRPEIDPCRAPPASRARQRLLAGIIAAAEFGLREHDRRALAKQMMERRLVGQRSSSNLPGLIELVMARPLVSTA
ncbi:hypothetical protein IE4803_PB00005 (plasmid) [Rhizobium etli bv. phaseoli str. IE4803]|nr:hypothetical protein IE4803_PB00005 [Rhizobium etli bv. phaseoli str. IE4803]